MNPKIENRFNNTAHSKTFRNIIRMFGLHQKAVLDIGCGFGEFLIHFGRGSVGVTLVRDEAEYGEEKGLDIRRGDIESDDFTLAEKFDVIFANNLFEHLFSPHRFLRKARRYLKPGGILILGVPCIPKIVSLLYLNKFRGSLAVSHINFFTRDTLVRTVQRGGWQPLEIRGFHFSNKFIDHLLDPIYPHFYTAAIPEDFGIPSGGRLLDEGDFDIERREDTAKHGRFV